VKRATSVPVVLVATALLMSSSAGAISTRSAGQQYLEDVASANTALRTFDSQIHSWTNFTADVQGEHEAASVLAVLQALQRNLLTQPWPQSIKGDVRFIGGQDIPSLEEDLRMISNNSSLGNGAFQLTFDADSQTIDAHAYYVRKDLGLPRSGAL
jgi:hypothetical protein